MISFLNGKVLRIKTTPPSLTLLVGGIGYDVLLPVFVAQSLTADGISEGSDLELEIYYHITERQPRPVLVGFRNPQEKIFFEKIIEVEKIGPSSAIKALNLPPWDIINAIETENSAVLSSLPGIGPRGAQKMIATLKGKISAAIPPASFAAAGDAAGTRVVAARQDAVQALIGLQYRVTEAQQAVDKAAKQLPSASDPQELLREVFRQQAQTATEN